MKTESIAFGVAGILFGLIAGWIIGTQQAALAPQPAPQPVRQAEQATSAPVLDEAKVKAFRAVAEKDPANAESRIQLGNLYFDAERFEQAIEWYGQALKLAPKNVDVSTDLGVSYYYSNQPDKALAQFDQSLKIDPRHAKTILNVGVVKAFGKQDLQGAQEAWEQAVKLAPDSAEGQQAKKLLDTLRSAHPGQKPGA